MRSHFLSHVSNNDPNPNCCSFFILYLGLVLNILVAILFVLSAILIYSLMMINIQGRTFELGVRRMIGTDRPGLILVIFMQAAIYSIPACIVGLLIAHMSSVILFDEFTKTAGFVVDGALTWDGILSGVTLGLLVPIVAGIGPVRAALGTNLKEALANQRSSSSHAVTYTIERTNGEGVSWAAMIVGLVLTLFGFAIYYLVPLALLSLNLSLFINIFFWILIGMICGLVQLSTNFEHLMEQAVVFIFLRPFENEAIVNLWVSMYICEGRQRGRRKPKSTNSPPDPTKKER